MDKEYFTSNHRSFKDLSGKKFGRLTALGIVAQHVSSNRKARRYLYSCLCECGNSCIISGEHLSNGHTESCGCIVRTHGMSKTKTHRTWVSMKSRCHDKANPSFRRYGGRGITVCSEWRNSFESFIRDMGKRPDGMSIDRIDNDGNYEPGNCRWADRVTQCNNRSDNTILVHNGVKMTMIQWARHLGINYETLMTRLERGWTVERALTQRVQNKVQCHAG